MIVLGRRLLEWTPRGDSLDPIWLRLHTWRVILAALADRRLWPWGRGPGSLGRDLRRYRSATGDEVMTDHAFCEPLEAIYEFGILGVLGLCLLAWGLGAGAHRGAGDFHAALAVWAVTMLGSITLRIWPFPALGALLLWGALWAS